MKLKRVQAREMRLQGKYLMQQRESLIVSHREEIVYWQKRLDNPEEQWRAAAKIRTLEEEIAELEAELTDIRQKLDEIEEVNE